MISGGIGCVGRVFLKRQNLTSLLQGFYTFFYTAFTSARKCKNSKGKFYMTKVKKIDKFICLHLDAPMLVNVKV